MERKKTIKYLKDIDTQEFQYDEIINVNDFITDMQQFLKIHGDNLHLKIKTWDDCWHGNDIELVAIEEETEEEFQQRQQELEESKKRQEEVSKQERRQKYEELKREFGDASA